ncbi:nucleoside recognition domain-containing protein [Paenibacillus sp. SYP-B4298]|uniref:nucleoside recognition domain-containing protein n=1 Tax=Paenibacillus sp. SYP-B4298 TaxID=2996034 RepID=UPI0022DD6184|nr:nucleoside recognition domain-containing protein [Paenibacillus sp. SYP-B4298]
MLTRPLEEPQTAVLLGFESSGKSALFRGLTGEATGSEANFRGSTVRTRTARLTDELELADVPGIRLQDDSRTTQEAVRAVTTADILVLVVRATHAATELPLLLDSVQLEGKRALLVLTFADKMSADPAEVAHYYRDWLGIPVRIADARRLTDALRTELLLSLPLAKPIRPKAKALLKPDFPAAAPQSTLFEHPLWGRPLSLLLTVLLFAAPVLLAYQLSSWLQPIIDERAIDPFKSLLAGTDPLLQQLLVGDYGIISLGWYSFLWAFPVVLLLGVSVALAEESGVKDRITDSLDGWMRRIGLNGRDLIPVLSGFGCNVVAVFQSRACSACTRQSCVSLIAYGSACSYQIGASLSVFGAAGHPWLAVPYVALLGGVGALHTRLWNRSASSASRLAEPVYASRTFLQLPGLRAVRWRVRTVIRQFVLQAMPIFLGICLLATVLQLTGIMAGLSRAAEPLLQWFHLPAEAAGGVIFSILRKDGLLVLNQGEGDLLASLSAGQVLVLVYLASTLTACLVTLWTVRKELGWAFAGKLAGKQAATSLISTMLLALLMSR